MTKFIILLLSLIFSLNALAELPGAEITSRRMRGNIIGALFKELVNVPYDDSNLADGLGQYLGRFPKSSEPTLSCEQILPSSGQDIGLRCALILGLGKKPSMKISFSGTMDPLGTIVSVDPASVRSEVDL